MKKTILIADHSHAYLKHIAGVLQKMGFSVLAVEKSNELLQQLGYKSVDMIIVDADISSNHLFEILDWLKGNEKTSKTPVVLISEKPELEMADTCRQHGCVDYIKKPISLHDLHRILQNNIYSDANYNRLHARANYFEEVSLLYNDQSLKFKLESISEGGVFIETDDPLPLDSEVEIFLDLEGNNILDLKGKVIYINKYTSKSDGAPKGMAVEFIDKDTDKYYVIRNFVQGLLTTPLYRPT